MPIIHEQPEIIERRGSTPAAPSPARDKAAGSTLRPVRVRRPGSEWLRTARVLGAQTGIANYSTGPLRLGG